MLINCGNSDVLPSDCRIKRFPLQLPYRTLENMPCLLLWCKLPQIDSLIQAGRMPTLFPSTLAFLQRNSTSACGKIAMLGSRGAGMTALAEILMDRGHHLIGYDQSIDKASASTNREIEKTNLGSNCTHQWEWNPTQAATCAICICSPAIRADDLLRQRFVQAGIPTVSLHQALNGIFADHHQICVAGTHGKSTTTAMLAWIMEQTERGDSYFIGAKFQDSGRSGKSRSRTTTNDSNRKRFQTMAVIESCEFNRSFHQLSPSTIVLTGLERDHFDCFKDQHAEDEAFLKLLQKLPADGSVIYNADCLRSRALVHPMDRPSVSCSVQADRKIHQAADFHVIDFEQRSVGIQFRIQFQSESALVKIPVFGRHNAANAAHAMAAFVIQGGSISEAADALYRFPGIERRFQDRGSFQGMALIDDYAHHPTAIRTTLQAARKKFPKREIRVCFEPHQLIRLAHLQSDFVDALCLADTVYVLPVLAARETASTAKCHQDSHKLIIRLRSRGTLAFFSPNLDHVVRTVDHSANPNAVLLTMGAGSTHLIHDKLTDRLRQYSVA